MKISELYGSEAEKTIYIVGTGPSLRVFPVEFLRDKITIGLNNAWQSVNGLTYILTIHPETLPPDQGKSKIVTKRKGCLTGREPYYFFQNNKDVKDFEYLYTTNDTLYVGRGIHTGAMSLAAKLGATMVVLVGCDFFSIRNQHHATNQHTQFHGLDPIAVYREYYYNARQVRTRLTEKYPIDFLSMSPFLGVHYEEDFEFLLKRGMHEKFPHPVRS